MGGMFQLFRVIVRALRVCIFGLLKCLRAPALFVSRVNLRPPLTGVKQMSVAVRVVIRDLVQCQIASRIFLRA